MSNNDLMTAEENTLAAAQGWALEHVYDLETSKWRVMVLGMPSAEATGQAVVNRARMGDTLAQKALSLIMKSNQRT